MNSAARTLADALELILSDKARDRVDGLAAVKRILKLHQRSPELTKIKDDSFHTLFEGLFKAVTREKANYSRATKARQQETTESRLNVCADAIRATVEAALPRLRLKTLNALVGHFVHVLPNSDRTFFEPLSVSYLKSLSIVLSYSPHVEHLSDSRWHDLVDLCLTGIQETTDHNNDAQGNARTSFHTGGLDSLHSRLSQPKVARPVSDSTKAATLFQCLNHLIATTAHSLVNKARGVCNTVLAYLDSAGSVTDILDACTVLRQCLDILSLESISETASISPQVFSLIAARWRLKSPELRDEILKILMILERHLVSSVREGDSYQIVARLQEVLEALMDDYVDSDSRLRRGHLTLEELALDVPAQPSLGVPALEICTIKLRKSTIEADHNYAVLYFIAALMRSLDGIVAVPEEIDPSESPTAPRKRRKIESTLERCLRKASSSTERMDARVRSLQIITFFVNTQALSMVQLQDTIDELTGLVASSSSSLACWSFVALGGCAKQNNSTHLDFHDLWSRIWITAFKLVSSFTHCRAASHLLATILRQGLGEQRDIKDSVEALVESSGLNHPSLLCDSSLSLWNEIQTWLETQQQGSSVGSIRQASLSWIIGKWSPSNFENRAYALQCVQTLPIGQLLQSFLSTPTRATDAAMEVPNLQPLCQFWQQRHDSEHLLTYLIDQSRQNNPHEVVLHPVLNLETSQRAQSSIGKDMRNAIVAKLSSELEKILESLQVEKEAVSRRLTKESLLLLFDVCVSVEYVCTHPSTRYTAEGRLSEPFSEYENHVWNLISTNGSQDLISDAANAVLDVLSTNHLQSTSAAYTSRLSVKFLQRCVQRFENVLQQTRENAARQNMDVDEIDMEVEVPDSQSFQPSSPSLVHRNAFSMKTSRATFLSRARAEIMLVVARASAADASGEIPKAFVDCLAALPPSELLSCAWILEELKNHQYFFTIDDAERLLEQMAVDCMQDYEFRCSEVFVVAMLQLLTMTVPLWTDMRNQKIANYGEQVYDKLLQMNDSVIRSSDAQKSMSDFLFALYKFKSDYGSKTSRPSPRTTILRLLKNGTLVVQYHLAYQLPQLFAAFIVSQHDLIFDDVRESLPRDQEHTEGLALRLLVFSLLGSDWSTLLRKCVYHIFETAGLVESTLPYATCCVASLADKLGLTSPKELFSLQAPQIIYTQLQQHDLTTIPFAIFGFQNLSELLRHSESEIFSQIVMHGKADQMEEIQRMLGAKEAELMRENFAQTAAYCFATDVSTVGLESKTSHVSENRMNKVLDKSLFTSLLEQSLASVLSFMLLRAEHEETFGRTLEKQKSDEGSLDRYRQMKISSANEEILPLGQQPSFKTKYLLEAMERVCRRLSTKLAIIWTPYMTTLILRNIMNDIHPSLGQFHVRRTLRRVRIVVCLAGKAAVEGYALEILLHFLRPYLMDTHCAVETFGIYRYLLANGQNHLSSQLSFVAGTSISIYLGLQKLLQSGQDSTTQESQHLSMLTDTQTFREWLSTWLNEYKPRNEPESTLKRFQVLMQAARKSEGRGSSSVSHMHESRLLQLLIEDLARPKRVLTPAFIIICLKQLCRNFEQAESYRVDICRKDAHAASISTALWQLSRMEGISRPFMLWMAHVLARAFRSEGQVARKTVIESNSNQSPWHTKSSKDRQDSQAAILNCFINNLRSEDYDEAITAEITLRSFLHESKSDADERRLIPGEVADALSADNEAEIRKPLPREQKLEEAFNSFACEKLGTWSRSVCVALLQKAGSNPTGISIVSAIESSSQHTSVKLFAYILHFVLECTRGVGGLSQDLPPLLNKLLESEDPSHQPHQRQLVEALVYLWAQPYPAEKTRLDRHQWLKIDLDKVALTAARCNKFRTSLYFAELHDTIRLRQSRRGSALTAKIPDALLLSIFKNIDEPDAFHGVAQHPDLDSIAERLAFEGLTFREVLLRGAQSDSRIRAAKQTTRSVSNDLINSLARLNMSSLTYDLGLDRTSDSSLIDTSESVMQAAMRLNRWDVSSPLQESNSTATLYHLYQTLQQADDHDIRNQLDIGLENVVGHLLQSQTVTYPLRSLTNLVALNEADEILSSTSESEFLDAYDRMHMRKQWSETVKSETVKEILTTRETLFGIINSRQPLQKSMNISRRVAMLYELKLNLHSSEIFRSLGYHQRALNNVAYLAEMLPQCKELGLDVKCAVQNELSNVMWEQGELAPSIQILKDILGDNNLGSQVIKVGKAGLLATLGNRVSTARQEKPDEILNNYLLPARNALQGQASGQEAGRVYHEFATYCHAQLSNQESLEEFRRVQDLASKRASELKQLDDIMKSRGPEEQKQRAKMERNKAKRWLELDDDELKRIITSREKFLRQSLENYVLALAASDEHDTDVLRFVALWLEHATDESANEAVADRLDDVPLHKFAPLMNQLASRLQQEDSTFQRSMIKIVGQICIKHPYHGMYHIYAGCNTKGGNDANAISRNAAAMDVAARLQSSNEVGETWSNLQRANDLYINLAAYRSDTLKSSGQHLLKTFKPSKYVEREVPTLRVPPITLTIAIRPDCNYRGVATVTKFHPYMTIANGLSAPKVITAMASDGTRCKQLLKAGSDDLRQDAIMEQVFEVASTLLQSTRVTRLRDLRIRTYKVIPLNANAGAIEFVPNTMALLDFVKPAHQRYFPKDIKWDQARLAVDDGRGKPADTRLKIFKEVTDRFHPVLRHFFFEYFEDPEVWYSRRLAYTRSTASISILGHALGLGDRHCQNILLDKVTGEVVHIDLGVAFEAGRVLQVPEVVPFRLTQDIVDGMGIMSVEGVFRRCCEFTLEALRDNRDAIMTLLNVLRYDPLYSWSMSPLRAKRLRNEQKDKEMSEQQQQAQPEGKTTRRSTDNLAALVKSKSKSEEDEGRDGGEADRALSVVERKLSPTLSVGATVNELIQQATDERNLAMLFCGWAAWA